MSNQIGLLGIDFVELSSPNPKSIEELLIAFGFSKKIQHEKNDIEGFSQNDIHFFLNNNKSAKAHAFAEEHGPSISAMGWKFQDPETAYRKAIAKGATPIDGDYQARDGKQVPAIVGIGGMILYFTSDSTHTNEFSALGFRSHTKPRIVADKGFLSLDHLTNNVQKGTMHQWADFYKNIFEFTEVRYFDIRGSQTGLTSYALRSPCGTFCIPINEGTENKSQINEYLEEYRGPGVQHLAFLTENILQSLDGLKDTRIETLDIDDEYYQDIFKKFPQVSESHDKIKQHQVLVDGDEKGYLLQIFTKNVIGPIFIEIIQRNNHNSFGEGNFGALFRSIERDQMKRGYLQS